jgi:putative zinc finger/helix-turn-helix YgiT family protein
MPMKGEKVECVVEYYKCPITDFEDGNSWTPGAMLDGNLLRARDAYRRERGLLTSGEIIEIRKKYGFTQKELANLLGWGDITISRYETSHIQDETYDRQLRIVMSNPAFVLDELIKHKNPYSDDRYAELKSNIEDMILAEGNVALKRQELRNRYVKYSVGCDANGNKPLDIDKIADMIAFFAYYVSNLFKVKLMKLLWYADVLHFNKYGTSMTGLIYQHKPLGALPIGHNEIIYLPTVSVIEEETEYGTSYHIVPKDNPVSPVFTLEEQEILTLVAKRFKSISGRDLSEYMHSEKVYKNTADGEIILYSNVGDILL